MAWAAAGAILGGVGGAAGGIGGLFGNKKDGSRGLSAGALNPAVRQLNYLFGQPTVTSFSSRGAPATMYEGYAENDVFGGGLRDTISAFLQDPRSMVPGTNTPLWESIYGGEGGFEELQRRFASGMQGAVGTAAELTQTGLPTDPSAYFDEAIRRLGTDVTPMIAERAGLGTGSSGFGWGVSSAANDLLGQASLAGIDLQEAATNRRMQAAPLLATLLASEQSVPLNIGTMLSEISQRERLAPVSLFQSLMASGSNQGPYSTPGYNPVQSGPNYGAAVQGISGILNALGQWNSSGSGATNDSSLFSSQNFGSENNSNNLLNYGGDDYLSSLGIF